MKKTFYINPCPAARPRVTRWSVFYPKKYTQFREDMELAVGDVQFTPFDIPIYARLDFFVQIPKSWSKKKKAENEGKFCTNNSDIDNYCKAILDSLNGVYYQDDRQIVMIRARKYWSEDARIECEFLDIEDLN